MARSSSFALQINTMKQGLRGSHAQVMAGRPEAFAEARAINRRALGHEPAFEARPALETDNHWLIPGQAALVLRPHPLEKDDAQKERG